MALTADEKKKLEEEIEDQIEGQDEANWGMEETTDEMFEDVTGNDPAEGETMADEVDSDEKAISEGEAGQQKEPFEEDDSDL